MNDRAARIIRLLETRDDGLPQPVRRVYSARGFKDNVPARESCPDCLANDRVMKGCETCKGRGYLEAMREQDPYKEEKTMRLGWKPDRHERSKERDAELARLAQQTDPPKSEADLLAETPPEPWEVERRRMYRDYDYGALDRALESLRATDEGAYHVLHSVYVYGWSEPSTIVEELAGRGLVFVDSRMPDPIRAPGFDSKHPALERRDKKREAA